MSEPKEKEARKPGLRQAKPKELPSLSLRPALLPDPHDQLIPTESPKPLNKNDIGSSISSSISSAVYSSEYSSEQSSSDRSAGTADASAESTLFTSATSTILRTTDTKAEKPVIGAAHLKTYKLEWLDATHTANEQKVYSVLYRASISKGVSDVFASIRDLQRATGIKSPNTVRDALDGLIRKLSIYKLAVIIGKGSGNPFRVYTPEQVRQRRQGAGIAINVHGEVVHVGSSSSSSFGSSASGSDTVQSPAVQVVQNMNPHDSNISNPTVTPSSSGPSDDEKLAKVRKLFEQLSGGGKWREDRDLKAYEQVKHCEIHHFIIGMSYSLVRCKEHHYSTLAYAVPAILEHYEQMQFFPAEDLPKIAYDTMRKALLCLATGKWLIPEWLTGEDIKSNEHE